LILNRFTYTALFRSLNVDKGKAKNLFSRIAAMQAKREITGKIKLSAAEAEQILLDLRKCTDPYHDADGRIILVRMSQNELRKMFRSEERRVGKECRGQSNEEMIRSKERIRTSDSVR